MQGKMVRVAGSRDPEDRVVERGGRKATPFGQTDAHPMENYCTHCGKAATQCLERYQKLLDEAEARENEELGLGGPHGGETAAPSADDVRRLRQVDHCIFLDLTTKYRQTWRTGPRPRIEACSTRYNRS